MSVMRTMGWSRLGGGLLWAIALSACATHPATPVVPTYEPAVVDAKSVHSLQRQIRERNKRIEELRSQIAELESQLEALKVIDQDMEKYRKPSRPPATLTPLGTDPPQ